MKEKDKAGKLKDTPIGTWITRGNVTEQAILNFFLEEYGGQGCVDHKKQLDDIQADIIGFTSDRKKASIIVKTDGGYRMYTKGGPDFLGSAVTKIIGNDGNSYAMDSEVPADEAFGYCTG